MRILVTGANGFIGQHVTSALAQAGHTVLALSRHAREGVPLGPNIVPVVADALDFPQALMAQLAPDMLIHLAWETTHGQFWTAPANLDWVGASARLARLFGEAGGKAFIGAGTCVEYDVSSLEPLDEHLSALKPHTLYGVAKDATRRVIEAYAAQTGLRFGWVRIFHLYGPGEQAGRLVPSVMDALRRGEMAKTSAAQHARNFIHARDAGAAIAAVALSDLAGAVNIGAYENTDVVAVTRLLGQIMGREDLLAIGALPERAGEPKSLVPRLDRLKAIGFVPRFSLRAGLEDVVRGGG